MITVADLLKPENILVLTSDVVKTVYVISDLHLGAIDRVGSELRPRPFHHKPQLLEFLRHVTSSPDVSHLVLLGDIVDFWCRPFGVGDEQDPAVPDWFVDGVREVRNSSVFLGEDIGEKKKEVLFLNGNHDMEMRQGDLDRIFGEDSIRWVGDCCVILGDDYQVVLQHGHLLDAMNSSKQALWVGIPKKSFGWYLTRLAATVGGLDQIKPDAEEVARMLEMARGMLQDDAAIERSFDAVLKLSVEKLVGGGEEDGVQGPLSLPCFGPIQQLLALSSAKPLLDWNQFDAPAKMCLKTMIGFGILAPLGVDVREQENFLLQQVSQAMGRARPRKLIVMGHTHMASSVRRVPLRIEHEGAAEKEGGTEVTYVNSGNWKHPSSMLPCVEIENGVAKVTEWKKRREEE